MPRSHTLAQSLTLCSGCLNHGVHLLEKRRIVDDAQDRKMFVEREIAFRLTEELGLSLVNNVPEFPQPEKIHRLLDRIARTYCPVVKQFTPYYWSLMQVEYATDLVFCRQEELRHLYGDLTRTAIPCVKPDQVATFLGHKLHGGYEDEIGNQFNTRIEGTRIKHWMASVSIKMYDKHQIVLRVETTANDV
jgi:hypothetical protein